MQIQIGAIVYDVVETELESKFGDIDTMKCRIRVHQDMADGAKLVTIWHEVLHGILFNAGYREHNEEQIDAIAYGLMQVLADNPELREL